MKKIYFLLLLTFTFFASCENSDLDCGSELAKETVKEILYDLEMENALVYGMSGMKEKDVRKIFDEVIEIKQIRTLSKDEEIKKCECQATLTFKINDRLKQKIKEAKGNVFSATIANELFAENGIEIFYNIQETHEGEMLAETYAIDDFHYNITAYHNLIANDNSSNNSKEESNSPNELKKDEIYTFFHQSEDCEYEIWFIISPHDNNVKGSHIQTCNNGEGAGERKFNGTLKNNIISANINEKEYFDLKIDGYKMEYVLKKTVLENGKELTFSNNNTLEYQLQETDYN